MPEIQSQKKEGRTTGGGEEPPNDELEVREKPHSSCFDSLFLAALVSAVLVHCLSNLSVIQEALPNLPAPLPSAPIIPRLRLLTLPRNFTAEEIEILDEKILSDWQQLSEESRKSVFPVLEEFLLNRVKHPITLLVVDQGSTGQGLRFARSFSNTIREAEHTDLPLHSDTNSTFTVQPESTEFDVADFLRSRLNEFPAIAIVNQIELLAKKAPDALHTYCDKFAPAAGNSLILLVANVPDEASDQQQEECLEAAKSYLRERWISQGFTRDSVDALFARIAGNWVCV